MRLDKVYQSRSPTNQVTFQVDNRQRNSRRHRRLERKLARQVKLGESRLTRLEVQLQLYDARFWAMEDEGDLIKKYKELSEAQTRFIKAQKTWISELESQGTAKAEEFSKIFQLNRDLSATINCQKITIDDLEHRLAEGASNYAAIAALFQDPSLHDSLSVDSKSFTQNDIFTEFFPNDQNTPYTMEISDLVNSQKSHLADSLPSAIDQRPMRDPTSSEP